MAEDHLNSLQDTVRRIIRQEIAWSERRFKRITMSHDANNNPAELYGEDGKIYYRKAGGAGAELGTGGPGGIWEVSAGDSRLITATDIDMRSAGGTGYDIRNCGDIELSNGAASPAESPYLEFGVPISEGVSGAYVKYVRSDAALNFYAKGGGKTLGLDNDGDLWITRHIQQDGETKHYFNDDGSAYITQDASNNLTFYDSVVGVTKTLTQLAGGTGGLWEVSAGDSRLITATDIDMRSAGGTGYDIRNCGDIELSNGAASPAESPYLEFGVPISEGVSGAYVKYVRSDAALNFYAKGGSKTLGLDNDGDLWITRHIQQDGETKHYFNDDGSAYITQDASNNLTFYDSVVGVTKTLTQLAGGLWSENTTDAWLTTSKHIDMKTKQILNINQIQMMTNTSIIDLNGGFIDDVDRLRGRTGHNISFLGSNSAETGRITYVVFDRTFERIYMKRELWMGYSADFPNSIKNVKSLDFWGQTAAPPSPTAGELYYDANTNKLKVHNGTGWETISSA